MVTLLSNELTKRGHRTRVFQAYPPYYSHWRDTLPEFHFYGEAIPYNQEHFSIEPYITAYAQTLHTLGAPDIVIATQQPFINYMCYVALYQELGIEIPIISWIHGEPYVYSWTDLLKYATSHLAISKSIATQLKPFAIHSAVTYVGNPLNVKDQIPIARPTSDSLELLYIGRLDNEQKRVDLLLHALSKLEKGWHLTIIGDGADAEMLKELAISLQINDTIDWLGWIDSPWEVVQKASLFLLTSDYEGMPLVLIEALSRGIPALATICGGAEEIVNPGENGFLIPKGDVDALYDLLHSILHHEVILPTAESCIQSVASFDTCEVCTNIEKVLYFEYLKSLLPKMLNAFMKFQIL